MITTGGTGGIVGHHELLTHVPEHHETVQHSPMLSGIHSGSGHHASVTHEPSAHTLDCQQVPKSIYAGPQGVPEPSPVIAVSLISFTLDAMGLASAADNTAVAFSLAVGKASINASNCD